MKGFFNSRTSFTWYMVKDIYGLVKMVFVFHCCEYLYMFFLWWLQVVFEFFEVVVDRSVF